VSASQRTKGAQGEREVAALLCDRLGVTDIKRRLNQTRDSGHDLDVFDIAVEVKRQEVVSLPKWIRQVEQATMGSGKLGAVIHRTSRAPWLVTMSIEDWCDLVREAQ
jgi:hypothetical protein